ncbi:TlpA family protein disulfide reductase [Nannocystaceae bacterium ST9]
MARELLAIAGVLALVGCPRASTSATPTTGEIDPSDEAGEPDLPLLPEAPANAELGDQLELTIPLLGGESIELAGLRGRPVVLDISASWEAGWTETHALELAAAKQHPELAVIVVAAEPDDRSLTDLPIELMPAWDPAGALAAKLSVAIFPTLLVLDSEGRVLAVLSGYDDETLAALGQAIDEALAATPSE